MPGIEEKKIVRYYIEYFNTRADWIGWNVLKDYNNIYTMSSASSILKEALEYVPDDIKLRIVEVSRIIMDYDPNEDEE